jgi:hypothetical protein
MVAPLDDQRQWSDSAQRIRHGASSLTGAGMDGTLPLPRLESSNPMRVTAVGSSATTPRFHPHNA